MVRLVAGRLPPLAIVVHRGRRTGRHYTTPVLAFRTTDGLVVGVLYGMASDWVRNLQAAGGAEVRRRGVVREYHLARVVRRDEGLFLLPALLRGPFRLLGVRAFVRLTLRAPSGPPA